MKKFKRIYVEITNVCNMNCNFCPKTNRKSKFMNVEEFLHIAKEIKPYTDYICLHLMGEPLLNPNLKSFLDISEEYGFQVNLTTNGTLIKKNEETLLSSKSLRKISISLHSFEANDQEVNLKDYVNDIVNFVKKAHDDNGVICELRLWNGDSDLLKGCNNLNDDIADLLKETLNSDIDIKGMLHNQDSIKISDKIFLEAAEKFQWPDVNGEKIGDNAFCYGLRQHIGILVDGTVVPCCLDSEGNIPLGNIFKNSLEDILKSKRAEAIYNGFSGRKAVEQLCKTCGYARRFEK